MCCRFCIITIIVIFYPNGCCQFKNPEASDSEEIASTSSSFSTLTLPSSFPLLTSFIKVLALSAKINRFHRFRFAIPDLDNMWKGDALPLIRPAMSRDRFKMMLRFIRFDNENTRAERAQTVTAAPIQDVWIKLNRNLEKAYKSYECITIDKQLFPFGDHSKFAEYIPFKPAVYGIKILWACNPSNAYPLQGQNYTEKPIGFPRQVSVNERIVLNLVRLYKSSQKNVTTDNVFTTNVPSKFFSLWK